MGKGSAASTVAGLTEYFQKLKLALLIGICGAILKKANGEEIILGDVVISESITECILGRVRGSREIRFSEDNVTRPDEETGEFIEILKIRRRKLEKRVREYLQRTATTDIYPGPHEDRLFQPDYHHIHRCEQDCETGACFRVQLCPDAISSSCVELGCDSKFLLSRSRFQDGLGGNQPVIHFGSFASGSFVMKAGKHRDEIAEKGNFLAFEMEAAGICKYLSCIVVKGVCGYADSHKHKAWQEYSGAAAADCTSAILEELTACHGLGYGSHCVPEISVI